MNIIMVTHTLPWPEVTGGSMRAANMVRALGALGSVDLFAITKRDDGVPPGMPVERLCPAPRPESSYRGLRRLTWVAGARLPFEIGARDYSDMRQAFRVWARQNYDLAWLGRAEGYVALGDLIDAPTVVDLDDLEHRKIEGWLRVADGDAASLGVAPRGAVRRSGARLRARINLRRWRNLERSIAESVDAVTVCSELDRLRLGTPNAVVIPNGYAPPGEPVGRTTVGSAPTIVFPGLFAYPPNLDGAFYLVHEVLPRLRVLVPNVQVRLVGRYDNRMNGLASVPGVTLTGQVPEMAPELALADIVVVPIRFGSGTRVKILEAFSHRIPVVSTGLGSEGLDAVDDQHLLVGDDADAFAAACARLLVEEELRRRLTDAAHDLYWSRYRWDAITPKVVEVAATVARRTGVNRNERGWELEATIDS